MSSPQLARNTNGKIGELLVELELTKRGWHVERLDGAFKSANGDLIAIKGAKKLVIQVKTNGSQRNRAFLGYAGTYLMDKSSEANFYNDKNSPILTDVIVSVTNITSNAPKFYVFTVEEAENTAKALATNWSAMPKKDGTKRSGNFPISPKHEELIAFYEQWQKLDLDS